MAKASTRTRVTFGLTSLVAALLIGGSLVIGPHMRSPAQVAAEAAAPPRSRITVPVERKALTEPVVLRGRIEQGASIKLLPPVNATGESSVITAVQVKAGQRIREGQVALERSGEPMICLALAFPLYRDLTEGMTGPDVREMQRALRRLGFGAPVTGVFGPSTGSSLTRFYSSLGYASTNADPDAARRIAEARKRQGAAEADLAEAGRKGANKAQAEAALAEAREALAAAESVTGPSLRRNWVLRLDKSGRKVSKVGVKVGTVLTHGDRPLLELDGERPYVSTQASRDQAALLKVGQLATVLDEESGKRLQARVAAIGGSPPPGTSQATEPEGITVRFTLAGGFLTTSTEQSLRIELGADVGTGEVLAVPVTAVFSDPDGTTHVTVQAPDGSLTKVAVSTGRNAGGWVEVIPLAPATLAKGQAVVVDDMATPLMHGER